MSPTNPTTRIEFHILQSFPVTCLNRDDVGAPKTAMIGGVTRSRVSSQCWKRQVRLALQESGVKLAVRTKKIDELVKESLLKLGAEEEPATKCSQKIASLLAKDTLLFISDNEVSAFARYALEKNFDEKSIKDKELAKLAKKTLNPAHNGLDIALFGRMVASAPDMNVQACTAFSHAISTHKASNEVEFFTALDDFSEDQGSAHMGTLEYNSATYYRYISLNVTELAQYFQDKEDLQKAIEAFTKALFVAVPSARQTTQAGVCPWGFARVLVRQGQGLQVPFDKPVKAKGEGYLKPSIEALTQYLDQKEKLHGSLFGKVAGFDWGEDENFSIDHLINALGEVACPADMPVVSLDASASEGIA